MKKRLASLLLAFMLIVPLVTSILPIHIHADEWLYCDGCGEWKPEDMNWCSNCYYCEDCVTDWCEDCACCYLCAYELGYHCPECTESCVDPQFGDYPHCESCMRCEDCVGTLTETSQGILCDECIEDFKENEFNILCPNCEVNVIGSTFDDDDPMDENLADCGVHCIECYEAFLCPECGECTLCTGAELCEYCGICSDCSMSNGYHCPECEECYSEVGQCPEDADHCVNCCDDICDMCGRCTKGAEIEYCEICNKCENCYEHCPLCEVCYEEVDQCEDDGEHCEMCCDSEGWLCDQCGHCTEALGIEFCQFCGLCENCCKENRDYYGVEHCILDEQTVPEELDQSKHDKNHHILRYQSSSEECHDVWCIFPGCDYYISDSTPHEFVWKTVENATILKTGKRVGLCIFCGEEREEVVPKVDPPEYYFVEQPKDLYSLPMKSQIRFYVKIGEVGSDTAPNWGFYMRVSALPVIDNEKLPETVEELKNNVYASDIRDHFYQFSGMTYEKGSGEFPSVIYGKSGKGEGKYANYQAQGKKLTWYLAVYDIRGGKVTYSDPFTVDWNAEHNKHTIVWVSGTISASDEKLYFKDYSAQTLKFYDGTYHWEECSVCEAKITIPMRHRYVLKEKTGNCKSGVEHYVCKDCGHKFDIKFGAGVLPHTFADDLKYNEKGHWQYCKICGDAGPGGNHDLKTNVYRDCKKTIKTTVCETCGYSHIEHDSGKGHKYTTDGDFNTWYADKTYHWKICKDCGYLNKAEHVYIGGACAVCGIDVPQFAIIGAPCTHETELRIGMKNDIAPADKALFEAGKWNATWYDSDTGNAVGIGKTYPLEKSDEGHSFWAEIELIGGDSYYAYMEGIVIKTEYINVKGYHETCLAEGLRDHQVCLGCGQKFINGQKVDDVVIPKGLHTYDFVCDEVCNVCGFVRDVFHYWSDNYIYSMDGHRHQCTVCGILSGLEPHDFDLTWDKYPDCEKNGLCSKKCDCGYHEDEVINASGHKWIHVNAVASTCVQEGIADHYYCENCQALSKDSKGKETVGIKKLILPVDPNNHVGGDKIGYNSFEHYKICACGAHIENEAHTFDENGRCTVCHYHKDSSVNLSVTELTKHDMVLPTCISTGTKTYYTDKDGKIYLSSAGVKEVTEEDLILPLSTIRHVGGDYAHSETEHWIVCACGVELNHGEHSFDDNGVCTVCGFDKNNPEPVPTEPPTELETSNNGNGDEINDDNFNFPWWIIIVVCAAVILILVIVILFILKKNKKNDGSPTDPSSPTDGPDLTETSSSLEQPVTEQNVNGENGDANKE